MPWEGWTTKGREDGPGWCAGDSIVGRFIFWGKGSCLRRKGLPKSEELKVGDIDAEGNTLLRIVFKSPVHRTGKRPDLDRTGPKKTGLSVAVAASWTLQPVAVVSFWNNDATGLNRFEPNWWRVPILGHVLIHIPSILVFGSSKTVENWARYAQIHFYSVMSTILVNILRFNLFLGQISTVLGDLRLIIKEKPERTTSPVRTGSGPVLEPIKTDKDR